MSITNSLTILAVPLNCPIFDARICGVPRRRFFGIVLALTDAAAIGAYVDAATNNQPSVVTGVLEVVIVIVLSVLSLLFLLAERKRNKQKSEEQNAEDRDQ